MDCSLPCSSVHGIFQASLLEWVAISFSRGSSEPRDWIWVSCIVVRCFTIWATREAHPWTSLLGFSINLRDNYTWTSWDEQNQSQIDYIIYSLQLKMEKLHTVSKNKTWSHSGLDHELFVCFEYKFIYFNWRLITLQYCGGFCHTLTWLSHGCTCVPHPEPHFYLPPHPIPLGHPSAPVPSTLSSCIKPGQVICFIYDNIHV